MIDQQAVAYARQQLAAGTTEESIQQALQSAGWDDKTIREIFTAAQGAAAPIAVPVHTPLQSVAAPAVFAKAGSSAFQAQYPLSVNRKFWKKFLPNLIGYGIFLFLPAFFMIFGGLFANLSPVVITGVLFLVLSTLVMAVYAWYIKTYIRLYYYDDSESFITIRKGVITPKEIHIQYTKVQDVYVDQDLFDRLLGLYDVHLASATVTSGMEAHIDGVNADVAGRLKEVLLARVQESAVGRPNASQTAAPAASAPPPTPSQFHGDISSKNYPIQSVWLIWKIVYAAVHGVFWVVIASFYLYLPDNSSPRSDLSTTVPVIPVILLVAVWTVVFIGQTIYVLVWKKNYYFQFSPEYIVMRTSVFSRSERHIPYHSIQDVNVSQSVAGRVFGFANVTIQNATQGTGASVVNIPGQSMESAKSITEALKTILRNTDSSHTGL